MERVHFNKAITRPACWLLSTDDTQRACVAREGADSVGYSKWRMGSYFCSVRLRLPAHALILFWASKWFMPSVVIPSMDSTRSPTEIFAFAAFPPSVS